MSGFLGQPSADGPLIQNDNRLLPQWFDMDDWRWVPRDAQWTMVGFGTPWWPGSGMDASGNEMLQEVWHTQFEITAGAVARVVFTGVTRDVYGSVLPSTVVKLFKTADGAYPGSKDAKLDETTSDAVTGAYTLGSPYYPDTHFIVAYKIGTPDVEGTTVNTLIGA